MNKADQVKKHKLNVFLIKPEFESVDDFLSQEDFTKIQVRLGECDGLLIYKDGNLSKPPWVSIFEELPEFDPSKIWNRSAKAVFVLRYKERWFCFTFGYAKHLIDEHAYERNFGLIVTLNLSDPDAIRSIDKTNIGHVSLHSKEQATREIEISGFEFNNDIDLLKSVTAKTVPDDNKERETISGRDSVNIHTRVELNDFVTIAEKLHEAFVSERYKDLYPWIDKITEERDASIVEKLNNELVRMIQGKEFDYVWLAIPEVISWEDSAGFSYQLKESRGKASGPVIEQDIDILTWIKTVRDIEKLSFQSLKTKKVYMYWKDGRDPEKWSIFRCLNAELDLDGEKYILNDSSWYRINMSFVTEVDDFFDSIPDANFSLPTYGVNNEAEYLINVVKNNPDYALMDRQLILFGGGRSRIEFCDLFSNRNDIIHVKKYGGSSLLSHLFYQAIVSGRLFLFEEKFRVEVNKRLPATHKIPNPQNKQVAASFNVCLAIMSKVKGPLKLPFFSRVSFQHAAKTLQEYGYNVFKLKIDR